MGKSQGTQKTTQTTQLPKWYTDEAQGNIKFANTTSDNLAKPYMGNTVASLTPMQQNAINMTGANVGSTNAAYGQAGNTAAAISGYRPQNFLQGNVAQYMNPYIQNVEDRALGNQQRAFQQNLNTIGDQALNAKAFGGSRQGVAEGVAAAEDARQMGDLSAQLRAQGYDQATGLMRTDMDRDLQGQQLNLQAAEAQGSLAGQGQDAYLRSLNSAIAAGQINQQQAQALLDQQKAQYDAFRNMPLEQLNIRMAPLQGVQVPTTVTQSTPTSGNGFLSALGGIGSIISGLGTAGIISDKDAKTNIRKIGKDGFTGLDIYSYDYKDDVAAAKKGGAPMPPKRVGPMAQDIEKKVPGSTRRIGGKMVVKNFGFGG